MIENINGKHETVHFKEHNAIKMYLNDEFEDYPEHWHTPVEIIFPIENHYMVSCGNVDYHLKEGDILLITPCTLHRISAPKSGMRIIFQVDLSLLNLSDRTSNGSFIEGLADKEVFSAKIIEK